MEPFYMAYYQGPERISKRSNKPAIPLFTFQYIKTRIENQNPSQYNLKIQVLDIKKR